MKNTVQLLDNDIIFVQKVGPQSALSMISLFEDVSQLAMKLRTDGKRVLILADATHEGPMDADTGKAATGVGKNLSFDKSATFGTSQALEATRDKLINAAHLNDKVADFRTRAEAERWLLS